MMSDDEKRQGMDPIPPDVSEFLNTDQKMALNRIAGFGWKLRFIRRPLFDTPTVVAVDPEGNQHAVLEEDGEINMNPDIVIRD
ncbi:conserved hypothetical protein [gamma proteobacterium HTCC5015]|nr:conserved hypothetical protein [gamma proteobacterium HTCC5015]